jgi:hypothetical protein
MELHAVFAARADKTIQKKKNKPLEIWSIKRVNVWEREMDAAHHLRLQISGQQSDPGDKQHR